MAFSFRIDGMENTGEILFSDEKPQWYIAMGDRWIGPLSATDVYEKILNQEITWAHYVWKEGQKDWERVCLVETFQAALPRAPSGNVKTEVKEASKPVASGGGSGKKSGASKTAPSSTSGDEKKKPPAISEKGSDGAKASQRTWFLYYNETQYGPFHEDEIVRFIEVGKATRKAFVWRDGMENWQRIDQVEPFAGPFRATKSRTPEPPATQSENRDTPRQPLVAKILLSDDKTVVVGVCRDISIGGMQVLTDKLPGPVGMRIRFNVSPTGTAAGQGIEPFVAQGVVVRVLEDRRGFSFRFDNLSDSAKRAIDRYVS